MEHLRFWENKVWINEIVPYGWFLWLVTSQVEDQKTMKDKLIDGKKL